METKSLEIGEGRNFLEKYPRAGVMIKAFVEDFDIVCAVTMDRGSLLHHLIGNLSFCMARFMSDFAVREQTMRREPSMISMKRFLEESEELKALHQSCSKYWEVNMRELGAMQRSSRFSEFLSRRVVVSPVSQQILNVYYQEIELRLRAVGDFILERLADIDFGWSDEAILKYMNQEDAEVHQLRFGED